MIYIILLLLYLLSLYGIYKSAGLKRLMRGKKWREIMALGLGEIIKKGLSEDLNDE